MNSKEQKYFAENSIRNTPNTAEFKVHLICKLCRKELEKPPVVMPAGAAEAFLPSQQSYGNHVSRDEMLALLLAPPSAPTGEGGTEKREIQHIN